MPPAPIVVPGGTSLSPAARVPAATRTVGVPGCVDRTLTVGIASDLPARIGTEEGS